MCASNCYLIKNGKKELFLADADQTAPDGDTLFLENIFGEGKMNEASIKEMAWVDHRIILEQR